MEYIVYKTFSGHAYIEADSLEEAEEIARGLGAYDMNRLDETDSLVEEN